MLDQAQIENFEHGLEYSDSCMPSQEELKTLNRAKGELVGDDRELYKWLIKKGADHELVGKILGIDRSNVLRGQIRLFEKLKYLVLLPQINHSIIDELIKDELSNHHYLLAINFRKTKNYRQTALISGIPESTARRKLKEIPAKLINLDYHDEATYYTMIMAKPHFLCRYTK